MKEADWIKLNNEKRELLTKENKAVYEDMLVYLRMSNKSQEELEPVLIELLDHLLDAQVNGKRAEDVFGENPKAFCDELLTEMPKPKAKEFFSMFAPAAAIGLGMWLLTSGADGRLEYSLISLIGMPISGFLWLITILYGIRVSTFQGKKKGFAILYVYAMIATLSIFAAVLLDHFFGKPIFILQGTTVYIVMAITAIVVMVIDYRTFGILGVLFVLLFVGAQFVAEIPYFSKEVRVVMSIILSVCAFLVLLKAGPGKQKKASNV